MRSKRRSTMWELMLLVQTNVGMALVALGIVAYIMLSLLATQSLRMQMNTIGHLMADMAASELEHHANETPTLQEIAPDLFEISAGSIDRVILQRRDGLVLTTTDPALAGQTLTDAESQGALTVKGEPVQQIEDGRFQLTAPVYVNGEFWGVIRLQGSDSLLVAILKGTAWVLLVVILVVVGLSGVISRWRAGFFVRPLKKLSTQAHRMAAGDLTCDLTGSHIAELDDLAHDFRSTTVAMRELLGQVQLASDQVVESSHQLASMAGSASQSVEHVSLVSTSVREHADQQLADTAHATSVMAELSEAIDQIARGAVSQASGMTEAHELTNRMTSVVRQIGQEIEAVATQAQDAVKIARSGQQSMSASSEGMQRIETAVGVVAQQMARLSDSSARINEVILLIGDVAEQTNLLALNAAIEAARAGEAGRGFAVVAEEVRTLANRTQSAAGEVTKLVKAIQSGTKEVLSAVEQGKQEVNVGLDLTRQTGTSLGEIVQSVQGTEERASTILGDTRELIRTSESVQSAIADVAAVAEQNSAAAEQMMAGSKQVRELVHRVSDMSCDTAGQATSMSAETQQLSAASEEIAAMSEALIESARILQSNARRFTV